MGRRKYTREEDIDAIVSSMHTGSPAKSPLIDRLIKKYSNEKCFSLLVEAFYAYDKKYGDVKK